MNMTNDTQHRPKYLDEMIGQSAIKQKVSIAVQAALQRGEAMPHCLLTSGGRRTWQNHIGRRLVQRAACSAHFYDRPVPRHALRSPQHPRANRTKGHSLVDEFHGIGRYAAEELLIVLEEGVLNVTAGPAGGPVRIQSPPFTLCAATTYPEAISAPLAQRFGLKFRFEFYADRRSLPDHHWDIPEVELGYRRRCRFALARRARGVPRIGLRLAERARDVAQAQVMNRMTLQTVNIAMKIEGVDDAGLSREERQLLRILADADPRPLSARSLALGLGSSIGTVHDVLEPPLVRLGLMTIGAGAVASLRRGENHVDAVGLLPFP
jgi:Holliday junction DNA helicase RuvB